MPTASPGSRARGPASPPTARSPRSHKSRGQALVEFALLTPFMLLMLAVGVDAGRLFFTWIEAVNSAREGAAYAAGNPTDTTGITAKAVQEPNSQAQSGVTSATVTATCANPSRVTIACSTAVGGNGTGNTVTVAVSRTFSFLTPFVSNIVGNSFTITGNATAAVFGLLPNGGDTPPSDCHDPRVASFTVNASNLTVQLDASNSTPNSGRCAIASYAWDMGDGLDPFPPIVGKQVTYTYATAGTYTITLITSNPGGSESKTATVALPLAPTPSPSDTPPPSADPSPSPVPSAGPICSMVPSFTWDQTGNSTKVNVYGAYTGQPAPDIWFWTYGDGDVAFGQAPTRHTYSGNGPYTISLTILSGSCSGTISETVNL